jgi:hypothetical protein
MVKVGNFPPNLTRKLKVIVCETPLLLLHENSEVGVNFTFFGEAELLKLGVFGRSYVKLS